MFVTYFPIIPNQTIIIANKRFITQKHLITHNFTTMKKKQRAYAGKDVEMLLVLKVMIGHAISIKDFLIEERPIWKDPFFDNTNNRIDEAFSNYLGIDNALNLREATQLLLSISETATDALSKVKVQIEEDFRKKPQRRDAILQTLSINRFYRDANKGDQEALIQLLYTFEKNLTPALKKEIVEAGTNSKWLNVIIEQAILLRNANVTQETAKDLRKSASADKVEALNELYLDVKSIATIARRFLKGKSIEQSKFSYSGNLKQMNRKPTKKKTDADTNYPKPTAILSPEEEIILDNIDPSIVSTQSKTVSTNQHDDKITTASQDNEIV